MTVSGSKPLQLLFLGTLLISAAVLCQGDPVLDSDGDAVGLYSAATHAPQYLIQNAGSGVALAALGKSTCEKYVVEVPKFRPIPVEISGQSSVLQEPYVQLGVRYGFTYRIGVPRLCHTNWFIGDAETAGETSFRPIIAGDIFSSKRVSWFEVRSTEEKGIYKLAACPCKFCEIICPEVGSYVINGTTVLGIGGSHYTVRFVKSVPLARKAAAEQ